jgi:glutamate/tyrosine decarboxylase-like PLP-dependent enzyme
MDQDAEHLRQACATPLFHPSLDWLREAGAAVTELLIKDYWELGERPVGRTAGRAAMESLLRQPPAENGQDVKEVLEEIQDKIIPHTLRPNHPRFLAFIPGAPSFVSILGDWLCASLNFFAGVWKEAPAATEVEIVVLDWFKEFLGYPAQARGILTSGGSEANLTALVVAREKLKHADRERAVLYASEQRHWSIDRAAKVIGLRAEQVRRVATGSDQRLAAGSVERAIAEDRRAGRLPWVVVANAGATNTGGVDPLPELAALCREQQLWLHVDGAYGWPAVLTDTGREELRGIDRADSLTLDPHKWFGQTFEAGCVLIREGKALAETFQLRPEYMQDVAPGEEEINFADHGIALTRRFRALKIWFSIKVLGVGWFRQLVNHCCHLAAYAQKLLENDGVFEILSPRQFSIVCFRFVPRAPDPKADAIMSDVDSLDALNLAICERALATGRLFLSTTRLEGRVALRLCFVNWRTTAADVEEVVRLLAEIGAITASRC